MLIAQGELRDFKTELILREFDLGYGQIPHTSPTA